MFKLSLAHVINITIHNFKEKQIIYKWSEDKKYRVRCRNEIQTLDSPSRRRSLSHVFSEELRSSNYLIMYVLYNTYSNVDILRNDKANSIKINFTFVVSSLFYDEKLPK